MTRTLEDSEEQLSWCRSNDRIGRKASHPLSQWLENIDSRFALTVSCLLFSCVSLTGTRSCHGRFRPLRQLVGKWVGCIQVWVGRSYFQPLLQWGLIRHAADPHPFFGATRTQFSSTRVSVDPQINLHTRSTEKGYSFKGPAFRYRRSLPLHHAFYL